MNKATKKKIYEECDRLHEKFPYLTYEPGFGFLYFVALGNIVDDELIKDSTIARFNKQIGKIDISNSMDAINGLNTNNANTKRRSMKELLGDDIYEAIMTQAGSYWGHFCSELYCQLERCYFNKDHQKNFK